MKKKTAAKKTPARKAAPAKAAKKPAPKAPPKKKTVPRAHTRPTPPAPRPQPVPPGSEQPARLAGGAQDQHGPMHIPSQKPAPAYAQMEKRGWAGKPPRHNIPIPKR